MITEIHKDILTVTEGIICHQVNCLGAVGGLAGNIGKKWPKNKDTYRQYVWDEASNKGNAVFMLGDICNVQVDTNLHVANLFGQFDYGRDYRRTEYSALIAALEKVEKHVYNSDVWRDELFFCGMETVNVSLNNVYIPKFMGCGLGGGEWNIVLEIINKVFDSSDKKVHICVK